MYQGKQCPKCLRHTHEDFYDKKNGKHWVVERCASCKHPFDFEPYKGSIAFFDRKYEQQNKGL